MPSPPGLFITGTNTEVGKTYVTAMIAQALVREGVNVGVYKPTASGCIQRDGQLISEDAELLWQAAGSPGELDEVCPQQFAAPIAPHLAAKQEGKKIDSKQLRQGIEVWRRRSDIVLVEGAGGLMSPIDEEEYVADLAFDFGYPLLVVAANQLGVINQTLQTLIAAVTFRDGLEVMGIVLNQSQSNSDDASLSTNRQEIADRSFSPVLASVPYGADTFGADLNWRQLIINANQSPN